MRNKIKNIFRITVSFLIVGSCSALSVNAQHPDATQYIAGRTAENEVPGIEACIDSVPYVFVDYSKVENVDGNINPADYQRYLEMAKRGDSEAMRMVALCYLSGTGVDHDFNNAWKWFGKSAKAGNARAEYDIATLYRDGYGVAQDYNEAAYWFRKAASNGEVQSNVEVGDLFYYGLGVQQDYRIAAEYYWRAAERGNKKGAEKYAAMLSKGIGIKKDLKKAAYWQDRANKLQD